MSKVDLGIGDLRINLRKCGSSKDSIIISSDEGDGYTFLKTQEPFGYEDLENWIGQLEYVVSHLKDQGRKMKMSSLLLINKDKT
jgi:hypothetical protein